MKRTLRNIALVLVMVMALSCLAACGNDSTAATTEPAGSMPIIDVTQPGTAVTAPGMVIVDIPTETLPAIVAAEATTQWPEAFELLTYLNVLTSADAAAFAEPLTGEIANRALTAMGLSSSKIAADAASVTGAEFFAEVMKLLGYKISDEAEMLNKANMINLDRGNYNMDTSAALTVEQAANILRAAMLSYTVDANGVSTGAKLAANMGVEHVVLPDYNEPFNRPGSKWVSTADGSDITGEYTDVPLVILGSAPCWCDILVELGYALDDPANELYIPKYFRNTTDGGQMSEQFWKAHNGDNMHGNCSTDFTGTQAGTAEIYEVADYEYRNVFMNTFLGVSDEEGLNIYGFERAIYGPYTEATRPEYGYYICHHYWNAYGMGQGYEVVCPANIIEGTLTAGDTMTTTVDDVQYENAQSFAYGKTLTTAPVNAGSSFYFMTNRYGFMIGCTETPVA